MIKLRDLITEGKYPKSHYHWSEKTPYGFKVYMDDGEKIHTDYYDLQSAKKMQQILDKEKAVYTVLKWDKSGGGHDVNLRYESIKRNLNKFVKK